MIVKGDTVDRALVDGYQLRQFSKTVLSSFYLSKIDTGNIDRTNCFSKLFRTHRNHNHHRNRKLRLRFHNPVHFRKLLQHLHWHQNHLLAPSPLIHALFSHYWETCHHNQNASQFVFSWDSLKSPAREFRQNNIQIQRSDLNSIARSTCFHKFWNFVTNQNITDEQMQVPISNFSVSNCWCQQQLAVYKHYLMIQL